MGVLIERGGSVKVFLEVTQEKLSEVMRKYRKERKYTQKMLADYLGIDRTTYSKYETVRKPELDVIMKLSVLYNVSIDEFLKDFFEVKDADATPYLSASSPEAKDSSVLYVLDREEKQLLLLYRECVRKNELLEKAREIWVQDAELRNAGK